VQVERRGHGDARRISESAPGDTYRRQTRGGKGRIGMGTRAEDVVEHLIIASTHAYLLIFTNKGRVYWLKIYTIPDAGTTGKGKHASGLMNLQADETVTAFLPVKEFAAGQFIVMVTKQGVIKKCELTEFDNPMARGIIAMGRRRGQAAGGGKLSAARITFSWKREGSRPSTGKTFAPWDDPRYSVRGMDLEDGDYLVGAEVVSREGLILSIPRTAMASGSLVDYRLTARGRRASST
jgi:DNA gyrase subunit A